MKATPSRESALNAVASEWVVRSRAGLSVAEQRELEVWLAADVQHAEAYSRLDRTWAVFDRADRTGASDMIVTRLEILARRRRSRRLRAIAVTGSLTLMAVGFLLRSPPASTPAPAFLGAVPPGFESVRKLPDGSIVELNDGAEIAVQYEASIRRVRLMRGEAHFRVEKDATRPFLVQAGGVDVRAVGTAFTVQLAAQSVEVVVTEGRIAVDHAGDMPSGQLPSRATLVDAGNRVVVEEAARAAVPPEIRPLTETQIKERLAWRIPRLEFSGTDLAQAAALMNRSNRLQIILDDASIRGLRVSGTFRADNPEGFVRIVGATFDLKMERRGEDEIVLRRP